MRPQGALRAGCVLATGREAGEEGGVAKREKPVRGRGGRVRNPIECEHGQLRRSCPFCEYEDTIRILRNGLTEIKETSWLDAALDPQRLREIATKALEDAQ